jgi:hypothetical protein
MADLDLTDSDFASAEDQANVDYIRSNVIDDKTAELKKQALAMYNQVQLPIRNLQGTVTGFVVVMECLLCYAHVTPKPIAIVTHMRQHLKAERRGEYNNA